MKSAKNKIFVISGFSGAGKGTIMDHFRNRPGYALSISCTSRLPRTNETEGVSYYFISSDEFHRRQENGYFLESAEYVGNGYGTPLAFVQENLAAGNVVLLEIDLQGAERVRRIYPEVVTVFVTPPSAEELKKRLFGRNTNTPEDIAKRLRRACEESEHMQDYDYILVNDSLEKAITDLENLLQGTGDNHSLCAGENLPLISRIKDELSRLASDPA